MNKHIGSSFDDFQKATGSSKKATGSGLAITHLRLTQSVSLSAVCDCKT
jgi:hypothetical protein